MNTRLRKKVMHRAILLAAATAIPVALPPAAWASAQLSSYASITYHKLEIDGVGVFYREAGPKDAPTIVLLHGFPTSSHQYETLIPVLATRYHVIAPDYPGFGQSDAPDPSSFSYTFDQLAKVIEDLLVELEIDRYSLYIHDYGAPVGFRLMLNHPERIHALITQNGNAYEEGLGKKWTGIAGFWANPQGHPEIFDTFLSFETTMQRHVAGSAHPERYNPEAWLSEFAHLAKPGQRAIQSALLYDYRTNVAAYPEWQDRLRKYRPPTLVVWGANDPSFIAAGGSAFKQDVPGAEVHLLDAGHFALDEKTDEIAGLILDFMSRHPDR